MANLKTITLRRAEAADLDVLTGLFEAQLREHDMVPATDRLRGMIGYVMANPYFGFILLAMSDGEALGVAYAAVHPSLELAGMIGCLEELYVKPSARNLGVGSRLLAEVLARAQNLGWRGVELEVVAGHERVVSLYLRHGFRKVSRSRFSAHFPRD